MLSSRVDALQDTVAGPANLFVVGRIIFAVLLYFFFQVNFF